MKPNQTIRNTSVNARGKARPHVWRTGLDPLKHEMYHPWQLASAQARFRGEEFNLLFEDYYQAWLGLWDQKGRSSENLCMTRIDYNDAWSKDNIEIITRKQHCSKQREYKNANK